MTSTSAPRGKSYRYYSCTSSGCSRQSTKPAAERPASCRPRWRCPRRPAGRGGSRSWTNAARRSRHELGAIQRSLAAIDATIADPGQAAQAKSLGFPRLFWPLSRRWPRAVQALFFMEGALLMPAAAPREAVGIKPRRQIELMNGALEVRLSLFDTQP
jgi:hypothetical protein